MSAFYLIWQDPETRKWHPVGRLERANSMFYFAYTKGAKLSPRFIPFGNMYQLDAVFISEVLFPIFANRVMNEKRPEYQKYAKWSGLYGKELNDPLLLMARMGGVRATDTLQVYPVPEVDESGIYRTVFFCHGINHMPDASQARILTLQPGDTLFPMMDVQNPFDTNAVALRTEDPTTMIGYCPRHLSSDIRALSEQMDLKLSVQVHHINLDAPKQFQVLCTASASWPEWLRPCNGIEYEMISGWEGTIEQLVKKSL